MGQQDDGCGLRGIISRLVIKPQGPRVGGGGSARRWMWPVGDDRQVGN